MCSLYVYVTFQKGSSWKKTCWKRIGRPEKNKDYPFATSKRSKSNKKFVPLRIQFKSL